MRFGAHVLLAFAAAGVIAACGGGSNETQTGTLRLSLTDAPACDFDHAWVTVEKVRVHRSSSASDGDPGWFDVPLPAPTRVDLLTLTNGTLLPLGQTELPAGAYTQMRLVLSANTSADPFANAVQPKGSTDPISLTSLTTPSGQQSGLKMNVNVEVPAGQVADFAIDFDACKSFVRAGNSGKILLKPVLAVIPILSDAGQRIVGWVDPTLALSTTSVSAQVDGVPMRATPPDETGQFTLWPVLPGTYDLVITALGHVNAVMTGVPVTETTTTVIGNINVRLAPPAAAASAAVTGSITPPSAGAAVRALQTLTSDTQVEVWYAGADSVTGAYSMTLPRGALHSVPYDAAATTFTFSPVAGTDDKYTLEARSDGTTYTRDITLPVAGAQNFP